MTSFAIRSPLMSVVVVGLVLGLMTWTAHADIPRPPKPTPPTPTPDKPDAPQLLVKTDENAKEAHLKIPLSLLKQGGHANQHSDSGLAPMRTAVAGIAMSGAIMLGGLLLVRGRAPRTRTMMFIGLAGMAGIVASVATADVPPLPRSQLPHVVIVPSDGLKIPLVIEVVDDGPAQLTLPSNEVVQPRRHKPSEN